MFQRFQSIMFVCLWFVLSLAVFYMWEWRRKGRYLKLKSRFVWVSLNTSAHVILHSLVFFVVGFSNCACVTRPGLVSPQFSLHTCRLLKIPELLQGFGIGSWLRWGFVLRSVSLWERLCDGVEWAFASTRRDCAISVRATRHTVDSAIDPVYPLGAA